MISSTDAEPAPAAYVQQIDAVYERSLAQDYTPIARGRTQKRTALLARVREATAINTDLVQILAVFDIQKYASSADPETALLAARLRAVCQRQLLTSDRLSDQIRRERGRGGNFAPNDIVNFEVGVLKLKEATSAVSTETATFGGALMIAVAQRQAAWEVLTPLSILAGCVTGIVSVAADVPMPILAAAGAYLAVSVVGRMTWPK